MIWRPDLSIYNQADYGPGSGEGTITNNNYQVVVTNTGFIYWIPAIKLYADCSKKGFVPAGPGNSPDPQSCNIKVGSWVDSQEPNSIKFTKYDCCPEPYMVAHYRFTVKRAFSINEDGVKVMDIDSEEIDRSVTEAKFTWVE